jgi:DNA-directed RNA polymerase subunit RPC12/RpoP
MSENVFASEPAAHVKCPRCHHEVECGPEAGEIQCSNCGYKSNFYACRLCGSPVVLGKGLGGFRCPWCGVENTASKSKRLTAAAIRSHLSVRNIDDNDPNRHLIGGLVLVSQKGAAPMPGAICSVVSLSSGLLVTAEGTGVPSVVFPIRDVIGFDITNHGAVKGNGEFIGHEFDFLRSGDGVLVAHSLSRIRARPSIGSIVELQTSSASFTFANNLYTPAQLTTLLAPIQELIQASTNTIASSTSNVAISAPTTDLPAVTPTPGARPMIGAALHDAPETPAVLRPNTRSATSVTAADADRELGEQLQRLTELHQTRIISDNEFEVSRARLLEMWVRHNP